ncbi:MAG: VOC family protein [Chitinophagales bacterium]
MIKDTHLTIMVTDINRSIDFYINQLGFELEKRWEDRYAVIAAPGIKFGLHPSSTQFQKQDTNMSVGFIVDKLDSYIEMLEEKGIDFKVNEATAIRTANFTDPDGTPVYYGEMKI